MPLLVGCGIRGPLTYPRVPPAQATPNVPDPGLGNPSAPMPASYPVGNPGNAPAASAPAATPAQGTAASPASR